MVRQYDLKSSITFDENMVWQCFCVKMIKLKISSLISPSKCLIDSCWVTYPYVNHLVVLYSCRWRFTLLKVSPGMDQNDTFVVLMSGFREYLLSVLSFLNYERCLMGVFGMHREVMPLRIAVACATLYHSGIYPSGKRKWSRSLYTGSSSITHVVTSNGFCFRACQSAVRHF